jgi:hypothetical protein
MEFGSAAVNLNELQRHLGMGFEYWKMFSMEG